MMIDGVVVGPQRHDAAVQVDVGRNHGQMADAAVQVDVAADTCDTAVQAAPVTEGNYIFLFLHHSLGIV